MSSNPSLLEYHAVSFSAGRMDFAWGELTEEERRRAYSDWEAGKGLIGGDPRKRPFSDLVPDWGRDQPFFRALAMDDPSANNGRRLRELLASDRQVEVEIGFGRGDFLLDRARREPRTLFLGYETKTKATRLCVQRLERFQIENLWVSDDDCRFNIPRVVADGRVDAVHILFPDPWWKPQHKVKRLFSPPFIDLVAAKLRPTGLLHFKSDVQEYGEFVRYLVEQHVGFDGHNPDLVDVLGEQALTHREHWCRQHHRPVYSYVFKRR